MKLVIAGGGTGGHLFPGLAVAEELRRRGGNEVVFVGTARGIEARAVPKQNFPLELIDVGGLKGGGVVGVARGLLRVPRAILQSRAILRRVRPDLVVGVGGYASGPLVLAAWLMGVPTAILEQNSVPGFTNRVLGRLVRAVFAAFGEAAAYFPAHKVRLAGNPIRAAFVAALGDGDAAPQGTDAALQSVDAAGPDAAMHKTKTLLVCGGSQGAHAVNELVAAAMEHLAAAGRAPRIIHQTGAADRAAVAERYAKAGVAGEVREFIDDMASAYRAADLIVARAGATTIAELTALGRAALFIPLPTAADDHQTVNARVLERAGAARVLPQRGLVAEDLATAISTLLEDDAGRAKMAAAARALGRPHAASEIADQLAVLAGTRSATSSPS